MRCNRLRGTSRPTLRTASASWGRSAWLTRGDELLFAFTTTPEVTTFGVFDVSRRLRERGWLVPAYTFPEHRTDLAVLRVVVRNGFTHDLADLLLGDLERLLPELEKQVAPVHDPATSTAFHH